VSTTQNDRAPTSRRRWTWLARDTLAIEWIVIPATIVVVLIIGFGLKLLL
jgi:hypothetical protein